MTVGERKFSGNEINRLGDRLRAGPITPEDADLLGLWRQTFDPALGTALRAAGDCCDGGACTGRVKSTASIVAKLRREPAMALSRVRDIVGVRVVADMTRSEQDARVARLLRLVDGKVVDRRARPSNGYRAVHVEARIDDHRVEIQVRTQLQDHWAQVVETLADLWGDSIKYGGDPDDPEAEFTESTNRGQIVWNLRDESSDMYNEVERTLSEARRRSLALVEEIHLANAEGDIPRLSRLKTAQSNVDEAHVKAEKLHLDMVNYSEDILHHLRTLQRVRS